MQGWKITYDTPRHSEPKLCQYRINETHRKSSIKTNSDLWLQSHVTNLILLCLDTERFLIGAISSSSQGFRGCLELSTVSQHWTPVRGRMWKRGLADNMVQNAWLNEKGEGPVFSFSSGLPPCGDLLILLICLLCVIQNKSAHARAWTKWTNGHWN